jgi:peptidoglycan hydrolase-like protein with peptidoglycan-binding domain
MPVKLIYVPEAHRSRDREGAVRSGYLIMHIWMSAVATVTLAITLLAADVAPEAKKPAAPTRSKAAATVSTRKTGKAAPAGSVRSRSQMAPTKERYKQIQDALASKGYLARAEATGQWTDASISALKRFQANQNLEATGKINSLSLIALGLGPKHETPAPRTPAP